MILEKHKVVLHSETLRKKFRKLGIMRGHSEASKIFSRRHIPIETIIKLYVDERYSLRKLARLFRSNKKTLHKILEENGIEVRTSDEANRMYNTKYQRFPFSNDEKEKAYLMGFVKGDMCVFEKSKFTLQLMTNSTVESFVELSRNLFERYGHVKVTPNKKVMNQNSIVIYLDIASFYFLLDAKKKIIQLSRSSLMSIFLISYPVLLTLMEA